MTSVGPYARDRAGASRPGCHRQRRCRTSAVSPVRGAREEPGRTTRRSSATSRGRPVRQSASWAGRTAMPRAAKSGCVSWVLGRSGPASESRWPIRSSTLASAV